MKFDPFDFVPMVMIGVVILMFAGFALFLIGGVITSMPNWIENVRCEWAGGEWIDYYGACVKAGPPSWYQ